MAKHCLSRTETLGMPANFGRRRISGLVVVHLRIRTGSALEGCSVPSASGGVLESWEIRRDCIPTWLLPIAVGCIDQRFSSDCVTLEFNKVEPRASPVDG